MDQLSRMPRGPKPPSWFGVALLLMLSASALEAQRGRVHEDSRAGFKMVMPARWEPVPVVSEEVDVVASYRSNRSYEPKTEFYWVHTPMLRVMVFRRGNAEGQQQGDYRSHLGKVVTDPLTIEKVKANKVRSMPCEQLSIRIETSSGDLRLLTWIFDAGDRDIAVELEVQEAHAAKLERSAFRPAVASFQLIERTAPDPVVVAAVQPLWLTDAVKWRGLPVRDRWERRQRYERDWEARMQAALPAGWTSRRTKHYLIHSGARAVFTRRVEQAAEACRAWIEPRFAAVGDDTVMRAMIIVFANREDHFAYLSRAKNPQAYKPADRRIVFYEDRDVGNSGEGFGSLFAGQLQHYLHDKDPFLFAHVPRWLRLGLSRVLSAGRMKGKKLQFLPTEWEIDSVRDLLRKKQLVAPASLVNEIAEEGPLALSYQRAWFVRFLLHGRKPVPDGFLASYLSAVGTTVLEMGLARVAPPAPAELTDEEKKARAVELAEQRKQILEVVNRVSCPWPAKRWQQLQTAYLRFANDQT